MPAAELPGRETRRTPGLRGAVAVSGGQPPIRGGTVGGAGYHAAGGAHQHLRYRGLLPDDLGAGGAVAGRRRCAEPQDSVRRLPHAAHGGKPGPYHGALEGAHRPRAGGRFPGPARARDRRDQLPIRAAATGRGGLRRPCGARVPAIGAHGSIVWLDRNDGIRAVNPVPTRRRSLARCIGRTRRVVRGKQESPTPDGKAYAGIFEGVRAVKSRWLIAAWLVVLVAYALPPAAAQQVVVIKAWTIGPDNPSVTRFNNLQTAAERLNADLRREGAGVEVKVEGFFDTTNWDSYLRRVLLASQTGDAPDIMQGNASLAATWSTAGFG